jgi:caffeoyl-CoA O-methyltransferase
MAFRTTAMTPALEDYLLRIDVRETQELKQLRVQTAMMPSAQMQIGPDQGKFMRWLVQLIGAKKCIEIGVFTGYSALSVALGLPSDGMLVACDLDPEVTRIAQKYWASAGVTSIVQLVLGDAKRTLDEIVARGEGGTFDFAFIDADKESYEQYYEACLTLVRAGGLILIDNTLWSGRVADVSPPDPITSMLVALNQKIAHDDRVSSCILPVGDGLTLVRKR